MPRRRRARTALRAPHLHAGPSSPPREEWRGGPAPPRGSDSPRAGCAPGGGRSRSASRSPSDERLQRSVSALSSSLAPSRRPATLRRARAVPPVTYAAFASGGVRLLIRRCASSRAAGKDVLPGRVVEIEPVGQPDGAEIDRALPGGPGRCSDDELGRAAAEVAYGDAVRDLLEPGENTEVRRAAFLLRAEDAHRRVSRCGKRGDELCSHWRSGGRERSPPPRHDGRRARALRRPARARTGPSLAASRRRSNRSSRPPRPGPGRRGARARGQAGCPHSSRRAAGPCSTRRR